MLESVKIGVPFIRLSWKGSFLGAVWGFGVWLILKNLHDPRYLTLTP